ncbi:hypothetical protein ACIDE9_02320 [Methylophilus sp. 'Pure River']|uniref:hypothetical protein n=1 Tax=Methylophilus sp. 'Pure River' TaxID=3377117 RepID=UPI00398F297B
MRFAIILLCCVWLAACVRQPLDASTHAALHLPDISVSETPPVATYPEVDISEIESARIIKPPLKSATPTLLINLVVHDAPVQEVLLAIARESESPLIY